MANEVKHHRISMSQWSTLAVCPHFVPSRKPSPEADEGTAAHKEAAEIYSRIIDGKPSDAFKHEGKYPQAAWCAAAYRSLALCDDLDARPADGQTVSCAVEVKVAIQQTDPLVDGIYGKDILYYPWGYVAVQRSSGYWDVYHCSGKKVDFYSDESPYIFWNGCWCIKQGTYWYACDVDGDKIDGVYGDKITLLDNGNWKCIRGRNISYVKAEF